MCESQSGMSVATKIRASAWCMMPLLALASATAASDIRLVEAVKNRDTGTVRTLLSQRVDVNTAQSDGATALVWAVHRDDMEMVDLLIHAGARVNAADDLGATPL